MLWTRILDQLKRLLRVGPRKTESVLKKPVIGLSTKARRSKSKRRRR